jgi:serine/threonine protein kinase
MPRLFPHCYFCLIVEYMDKGTLEHLVENSALTVECIGALTCQVASALAYMHNKRRTHNDIKPANVLLKENGDHLIAKLADLGLADHSVDRERDHQMLGYTIWCLAVRKTFTSCPLRGDGSRAAIAELRRHANAHGANSAPPQDPKEDLGTSRRRRVSHAIPPPGSAERRQLIWKTLLEVIDGLWHKELDVRNVEDEKALQDLVIELPGTEARIKLEEKAREETARRCRSVSGLWAENLQRSKTFMALMASDSVSDDDINDALPTRDRLSTV